MSYRNPKAAPINTGAAVYEGINKLAGDVFTFANNERDRKGQLVADSLAAQQAVDDNVNKMGLSLDEDDNNFETQIFAEAQAAKKAIAAQYETMSKTFSSPEQKAKAKSEIARLNKYPENLVADLSTGKYITDMYDKAMQLQQGKTGSISKSNDINLLAVAGDMKTGGKNTKIETNAAGSRTLVTTVGKDTYKLNISNITNGLKTNPNQILFKTVQDDSPDVKMYQSALGIGDKASIDALIGSGKLNKTSSFDRSGKPMDLYTLDEAEADKAVSGLSASLLDVPGNNTYANTIWQDRLGEGISITEAVKKEGRESVLNKIRTYYKDKAVTDAKLQFGVAIGYAKPKVDQKEKVGFRNDKHLVTLSKQKLKGGLNEVTVNGQKYTIEVGAVRGNDNPTEREKKLAITVMPFSTSKDDLGMDKVLDRNRSFPMWIPNTRDTKDKQYPLELNYETWRTSTEDSVPTKQI
tara:strand:- start:76 stop:1473 length:1398 start_codon:yes stop_codon:yes gene_type:complete